MAENNGVSLEFIGKQLAGLREDVKGLTEDMKGVKERLDRIEHSQNRFRVRIALMETRDRDLAGDLAAIARIIERAGLLADLPGNLEEGRGPLADVSLGLPRSQANRRCPANTESYRGLGEKQRKIAPQEPRPSKAKVASGCPKPLLLWLALIAAERTIGL